MRGDEAIYREAIINVDREEAGALSSIATRLAHHGAAGSDVKRLRDRMASTVRLEVAALLDDARAPTATFRQVPLIAGQLLFESGKVDDLLKAACARHHVAAESTRAGQVDLHGADSALVRLSRVIDGPASGRVLTVGEAKPT